MEETVIYCENDKSYRKVGTGTHLSSLSDEFCRTVTDEKTGECLPVLAALVDHALKELDFPVMMPHKVEFIGYNHPDGRRTYIRSLCFVLQHAIRDLYPDKILLIEYSLPSGLYCEIREQNPNDDGILPTHFVTDEEIERIKERMQELIFADLHFNKVKMSAKEAEKLFLENSQPDKANLLQSLGKFTYSVYFLGGDADTFYGPLVPSTGCLKIFDLVGFNSGFCLQFPEEGKTDRVTPMKRQSKLAATLQEYSRWCEITGVKGVGTLNKVISEGGAVQLINIAEALHERKYADIADMIYERRDKSKIIMIAGPSSSGKTSSSKRLAIQCKVLGMNPKVIELDNYFVDREHTPKDENGEYDFESLHAMDLDLLNSQLNDLLSGKTIEIPCFDFKEGKRTFKGDTLHLDENDILIMEGIHALNPEMTSAVDNSRIFMGVTISIDPSGNIAIVFPSGFKQCDSASSGIQQIPDGVPDTGTHIGIDRIAGVKGSITPAENNFSILLQLRCPLPDDLLIPMNVKEISGDIRLQELLHGFFGWRNKIIQEKDFRNHSQFLSPDRKPFQNILKVKPVCHGVAFIIVHGTGQDSDPFSTRTAFCEKGSPSCSIYNG